eukprot:CAMPEP_0203916044 /NCGR_PEP_ID=MMETSP0359-20131031/56748_1 /ASSEMBLY_ACC=CAM_ASM_000338 /TAXON_ID=268821 /ORGANISM="Scrippsiella Hangoei, Strain SHTV-5" /LENGTH=290 /DNA_ID=CAMNT_0050842655 /DNA_START=41 /DNA_END=910 /DNA_ORIENTATION=+
MVAALRSTRSPGGTAAVPPEREAFSDDECSLEKPLVDQPAPTSPPLLLQEGQPLNSKLQWYTPPRRAYTRRELLADRIVNFVGAALAIVATPVLGYASWSAGDPIIKQAGFGVHGAGMITMLTCSALYHLWAWKWELSYQLLSLDHVGISAMIMGCYVPLMQWCGCLRVLTFVCVLGVFGWLIEAYKFKTGSYGKGGGPGGWGILDIVHVVRYLVMGWACAPVLPYMVEVLPELASRLFALGGLLYCVGLMIFIQGHWEYHLAIWHAFVVVASGCFYCSNLLALVGVQRA